MPHSPPPPEPCAIAFKEWAGVCDALGSGRQSLILRKGGVAEESGTFRPEHRAFWLYPTFVHQAEQGLRSPGLGRLVETPGSVALETLVVVEWLGRVDRVETLDRLADCHDWTEATVLARFHYRTPGLWALGVRAYRRAEPWTVAITPGHLGCKTWVPLDAPPPVAAMVPVLDDAGSARQLSSIRSAMAPDLRGR